MPAIWCSYSVPRNSKEMKAYVYKKDLHTDIYIILFVISQTVSNPIVHKQVNGKINAAHQYNRI